MTDARYEELPYLRESTIVKDHRGTEYLVTKVLRVNVNLTRLSDGAKLRGKPHGLTYVRDATYKELVDMIDAKADESVRQGAVVRFAKPTKIGDVTFTNELFVVFKDGGDVVNIIELGGNTTGRYYRVPPTNLVTVEVKEV